MDNLNHDIFNELLKNLFGLKFLDNLLLAYHIYRPRINFDLIYLNIFRDLSTETENEIYDDKIS